MGTPALTDLSDRIVLARQVAKALAAIGVDAALSPAGRALPLSPDQLTDPADFGNLLRLGSCRVDAVPLRPRAVVATELEAPSSNCQNTIFETQWEETADGATGPGSVFVKQPCADLATRLFANVIGFWKIECAFCQNLAEQVPIPMPQIHAVAQKRSRFAIVMENLLERPDTRLFVNRDLLEGVDVARAKRCLQALARLHAGFADMPTQERGRRLPLDLHPFLSASLGPVMFAVNRLAVAPCHKRAPNSFDDAAVGLYRRALRHWETLSSWWYREPLTLVHGDSHLGNFFESGEEMGMIDFQGAHWGKGIRDVGYFLINSMRAEQLAEHERSLVTEYCEEVSRLGAPLTTDEGWEQYRGFSFQTLMTAVVSLGLGSFTDSDAVMRALLERAVAATRRLEFGAWLAAQPSL